MVTHGLNLQALAENPELLEQLLEDGETIVGAIGRFVETIRIIKTPAAASTSTPAPVTPAAPIGVASSASSGAAIAAAASDAGPSVAPPTREAMENMDAEALVQLRKDLAAGLIADAPSFIAEILERRLGSSKP
jgi:hypothetical protein